MREPIRQGAQIGQKIIMKLIELMPEQGCVSVISIAESMEKSAKVIIHRYLKNRELFKVSSRIIFAESNNLIF